MQAIYDFTVIFSPTPTMLHESTILDLKPSFTSNDSNLFVSELRFILITLPMFFPSVSMTLSLGFIGMEFRCRPDSFISSKYPLETKYSLDSIFFAIMPDTAKVCGLICNECILPQSLPLLSKTIFPMNCFGVQYFENPSCDCVMFVSQSGNFSCIFWGAADSIRIMKLIPVMLAYSNYVHKTRCCILLLRI